MHPMLTTAVKAARRAGSVINRGARDLDLLTVTAKGPKDFVSDVDRAAEVAIVETLHATYPDHAILAEEGTARGENASAEHLWIIDPLDGTTNFLHGIPQFAISIGLEREGVIVAGVIYNPATEELFTAERGKGAFLNDQRLRVAARRRLSDAVIACGLPHHGRGDLALFRREFGAVQEHVAGLRRFGAAALDLAWVAAGRFDAFWERDLSPWDMAAGILMVREAGGYATDLDGEDGIFAKKQIIAGNEFIHRELLQTLKATRA